MQNTLVYNAFYDMELSPLRADNSGQVNIFIQKIVSCFAFFYFNVLPLVFVHFYYVHNFFHIYIM